ncbi:ATP-binding protein [archaeon]|jgi:chromosomal replication initiation ATPase DnaA|nr:ATP-binding protein [archaeon]
MKEQKSSGRELGSWNKMEWYEELDFDENPFGIDSKYVGNEDLLDEVFYSIMSGNIIVIQGEEGSGKTRVMKEIVRKFGGKGKIAYVNGKNLDKELNVETLINKKKGWFRKNPKNIILLLDDVEHISEKNMERIKYYFDQNYVRTVMLGTSKPEELKLSPSLKQRVWKKLEVGKLSDYEAVQVVRERLGNEMLTDRVIKAVYKESDKNMKKFMENCEIICKAYIDNKDIKEDEVKNILERGKK